MIENQTDVAIISIFYNRENNVIDSVNSLLSQTYRNLKIILVDDCSSDNTYQMLMSFIGKDERLIIFRNDENKGFTKTLIDVINSLRIYYVAIHGAGDISLPTRVEEQVEYLKSNREVGLVCVDIANFERPKFHQKEIILKHLLKKNRITHGAVMFRLEDYKKAGGYRSFFETRQDKDLWFRMCLVSKIHFLDRKLYKLVSIKKSVSNTASQSGLPTLLSEFSAFLILQKVNRNIDLFELYGEKSMLFFNPAKANKKFYMNIFKSIISKNYSSAKNYLDKLYQINLNPIHKGFLKLMKFIFNKIDNGKTIS